MSVLNKITVGSTEYDIEDATAAKASSLASVATSGSYDDLDDKPTIPAAQIQADWDQSDNTAKDFIKNKPTLGTAAAKDSTNDVTAGSTALVESGAVNYAINRATKENMFIPNPFGSIDGDSDLFYLLEASYENYENEKKSFTIGHVTTTFTPTNSPYPLQVGTIISAWYDPDAEKFVCFASKGELVYNIEPTFNTSTHEVTGVTLYKVLTDSAFSSWDYSKDVEMSGSYSGNLRIRVKGKTVYLGISLDDAEITTGSKTFTFASIADAPISRYSKLKALVFTNGGKCIGNFNVATATTATMYSTYDSGGDEEGFDLRWTTIIDID